MKKFLFLGIGSALMFTMGGVGPAQADNGPHTSSAYAVNTANDPVGDLATTGRCAACHRAHTAKAEYLLKQAQPQLCYSCHNATGATTNVVDGNAGAAGALRGGGFANARINSAAATKTLGGLNSYGRIDVLSNNVPALNAGTVTTSRHQIDGATAGTEWGNGTDVVSATNPTGVGKSLTLECGSCHDPHGNGNFRVLRPIPTDSGYVVQQIKAAVLPINVGDILPSGATATAADVVLAAAAIMSPVTGINIPDAVGTRVYTTGNYWLTGDISVPLSQTAGVNGAITTIAAAPETGSKGTAAAPDGYIANVANWCTTCHTRYLADTGSYKTPLAGSTATVINGVSKNVDANFTYRHRSNANYKQGAANCITCHVSHGSNASVGTSYGNGGLNPGDTSVGTLAGAGSADSRLLRVDNRGTCSMCHNV